MARNWQWELEGEQPRHRQWNERIYWMENRWPSETNLKRKQAQTWRLLIVDLISFERFWNKSRYRGPLSQSDKGDLRFRVFRKVCEGSVDAWRRSFLEGGLLKKRTSRDRWTRFRSKHHGGQERMWHSETIGFWVRYALPEVRTGGWLSKLEEKTAASVEMR